MGCLAGVVLGFQRTFVVGLLLFLFSTDGGKGNWNGSSNVPFMKDMIQSKAVLKFRSTEMIRPAIDTLYVENGYDVSKQRAEYDVSKE
ncbi:hypothetical protein Tco_0844658 [Tanacetum coccineum]